ncbi:MAG: D-tyrosyl-tRNA(Tyr) deacylase [Acidobacteria bacterium]|nr:D-tyrosyl-tRNA(Tyr) deacylase [Acidobacteriota bacterium]
MRAVLQRVTEARVRVDGKVTAEIGKGVVALVGIARTDNEAAAAQLAEKIVGLRMFNDEHGKMNLSLQEVDGAVLAISQFTLYGDCRKGRRPSFDRAAPAEPARTLYESFVAAVRRLGSRVETGVFQAMMDVELVNSGPVTLLVDTEREPH